MSSPKRQKITSSLAVLVEGNINCAFLRQCVEQQGNMIFLRHVNLSSPSLIRRVIFDETEQFQSSSVGILSLQIDKKNVVLVAISSMSESHLDCALRNLLNTYTGKPISDDHSTLQYWLDEINLPNYQHQNSVEEYAMFNLQINKELLQNFCHETETTPAIAMQAIFLCVAYRYVGSLHPISSRSLKDVSKLLQKSSQDDIPLRTAKSSNSIISFTYAEEFSMENFKVSSYPSTSSAPLALHVTEQRNNLKASFYYDQAAFKSIDEMKNHFQNIIGSALHSPTQRIASLPMLSAAELALFESWNRTEDKFERNVCIHQLFERQVELSGNETALVAGHQRVSYATLNRRSNQLAHHIRQIVKNSIVAVFANKSVDTIISFIAILKSGNAYAPVDPLNPRTARVLVDLNPSLVITSQQFKDKLPAKLLYVIPDEITVDGCEDNLPCETLPSAVAYILFTSGTTGTPKGVPITHQNATASLHTLRKLFPSEDVQSILISAAPTFCLFHSQLFFAFVNGAKGILADSILHIGILPARDEVTFLLTPSAGLREIIRSHQLPASLRIVALGGDVVRPELVAELRQNRQDVKIYSCHGCTEVTFIDLGEMLGDTIPEIITAGRPAANVKVYMVDENMQRVPVGFSGELCISGPSVTKGYLNLPEVTASRYLKNPFEKDEGYSLMYRTGDVARWTNDGRVQICGRMDFMVKINGIRVELGEVENALQQHQAVREAVVVQNEQCSLSAYIVSEHLPVPTNEQFRRFLSSKIAHYAIPRYYRVIDRMPRNLNGKIDRKLLPDVKVDAISTSDKPLIGLEHQVAMALSDLLKRDIALDDDFIDFGLDSITATQLSINLETTLNVRIPVPEIFEHSTVSSLCRKIEMILQGVNLPSIEFDEAVLPDDITLKTIATFDKVVRNIFLTGASGFIGAFLLAEILTETNVHVHCLIRGENSRLKKNLLFYGLWRDEYESRIIVVSGDMSKPNMGIDPINYENLCLLIDTVYHCAATVNFVLPYSALKTDVIKGTGEILRFSFEGKLKPFHFISSVAVHGVRHPGSTESIKYEDTNLDLNLPGDMGYARMKWISEKLVWIASSRGLPVTIYRPSYVFCHGLTGSVSTREFVIRLIRDCIELKQYPRTNASLQLIPVDYLSKVVVKISSDRKNFGKAYHLTPQTAIDIKLIMTWIKTYGYEIVETDTKTWLQALRENTDSTGLKPLLHFVQESFESPLWSYDTTNVQVAAPGESTDINFNAVKLMLSFLVQTKYLQSPPNKQLNTKT